MTDLTERLRKRMAVATALPWAINPPGMWWDQGQTYGVPAINMADARYYNSAPSKDDAEFIVDAVNALPDLLTTLETLTQENARLREALEPFAQTTVLEPNGVIVGLERFHFDRARKALEAK